MRTLFALFFSICLPIVATAFTIQSVDTIAVGDFVVSPAKEEVVVDPGQEVRHEITVINRTDTARAFTVSVEDMSGTRDAENPVALFGENDGPYSLKRYVTPEIEVFTLQPSEQVVFSVDILIPDNVSPGGLYGAVLVSSTADTLGQTSGAKVVSRIASLLLVTVSGDAAYQGEMIDFGFAGPAKNVFTEPPNGFEIGFENIGTIHTSPEGSVRILNMFGRETEKLNVAPFVVLPDSVRYQEVLWENPGLRFGRYTAVTEIARGYDDEVDIRELSFWIIPVREIVVALIVLILILGWRFRTRPR